MIGKHENIRHGAKNSEGGLSEEGQEQAKNKAEQYYQEIQEAEPGTLFFVTPSNIGRATETGRGIEDGLSELVSEADDIFVISVHDENLQEQINANPNGKFIITELEPTRQFGWTEKTKYLDAWGKYKKLFSGDDGKIVEAWIARPEEVETLQEETGVEEINPADFKQTPEEEALKYILSARRMSQIKEKHFPGREYIHIQAGHNPADLAALAMTGQKLTLGNLRTFTGGTGRDFVESASLNFEEDSTVVKYRDQEFEINESIDELIERLKQEAEERRQEWAD